MLRWLLAVLLACILLLSVLLFLGWLLKNNAAETTELVAQLNADKPEKSRPNMHTVALDINNIHAQQQAILNNLTCVNDAQCRLVIVPELSEQCLIAVNKIGAAQLTKLQQQKTNPKVNNDCLAKLALTKAICLQNQCSF